MQAATSIPELLLVIASWDDQIWIIEWIINEPPQNFKWEF